MRNTYQSVARQIIKNSIQSAIFVDDTLAVPFKAKPKPNDLKISRELYNSFIKNNVSIDFYRYSSRKKWLDRKDYIFKGRDLVILDWQLDNNDKEENTLKLLQTAVNTPSLHFVCIYTLKNPAEFENMAYAIKAFFSVFNEEKIVEPTSEIASFLDMELEEGFTEKMKLELKLALKEYSLHNPDNKNAKWHQLEHDLKEILGHELTKKLKAKVCQTFKSNLYLSFEALGYGLNEEFLSDINPKSTPIAFFLDGGFLTVDSTIILIMNKSNPRPSLLYNYFTTAILKSTGNFLTLLSLNLKSILRDSSGFINKEMDSINEAAFFYHKDSIKPEEAFFDFLLELWKSNLASLIYNQEKDIQLFNETALKNYRRTKGIDGKIRKFKKNGDELIDKNLAKLNYYYNIVENRNLKDFLRFGDIFNILSEDESITDQYLLCITAHCDCLHTENIKNQFFFVTGKSVPIAIALEEGDTGNNSFILKDKDIVCISWNNKPFTIFLENNKILNTVFNYSVRKLNKKAKYAGTIKENYAQRIANNAFSHPMRVGIFFATTK